MEEYVVLVDEKNEVLGTAPKGTVHTANTPVHRGISVFLFNPQGKLLLQQRSHTKKTWPLVWSNSVCGHPMLDEKPEQTAKRRLLYEVGIEHATLFVVLPDYRYRCEKDGVVENEFCPVLVGFSSDEPVSNPDEVEAVQWIDWKKWLNEVTEHPNKYSQWCVEETHLLDKSQRFKDLLKKNLRV